VTFFPPEPERSREATLHEILTALRSVDRAEPASAGAGPETTCCALCRLTQRSVERALRGFLAEFVNDPRLRLELRQARGFCAAHTPLLASLGDALAIAILYADLAEQTQQRWLAGKRRALPGKRLRQMLGVPESAARPGACPACLAAQEAESRYSRTLAEGLEAPDTWNALEAGSGLCVPHTELVMAAASPEAAERLRRLEGQRLAALQAELEEIVRKNDYRFRQEPWGPERDAWLRAIRKLPRPRT